MISGIFIVGAKRTAFGTFGGTLKNVTGTQLQTAACKATLDSAGVRPDQVDSVVIGNVLVVRIVFPTPNKTVFLISFFYAVFQSSQSDGIYLPRHTALHCGVSWHFGLNINIFLIFLFK